MRLIDADALTDNMRFSQGIMDNLIINVPLYEVIKSINNAPTVGGWTSVNDRLPETRHAVLVYTPHHNNIWAASMHEDRNWYIWSPGNRVLLDPDWYGPITHWMPLPEAPHDAP